MGLLGWWKHQRAITRWHGGGTGVGLEHESQRGRRVGMTERLRNRKGGPGLTKGTEQGYLGMTEHGLL